jgi:glycosyltransferase involved in cell wall biosynthesis
MRIVFLSHTHLGGTFVVGSHQLANELSRAGHRVAHVSTPLTPMHILLLRDVDVRRRFRQFLRPSISSAGVLSTVPMAILPWQAASRIAPLWRNYGRFSYPRIRSMLERHMSGPIDLVFIDQPRLVGLTKALNPRAILYRPTDLYFQMPGGSTVASAEALAIARSTTVVATSEAVARHVRTISPQKPTVVLPNGVELRHFASITAPPPEYAANSRKRAVYIGALDERFDVPTVRRLAESHPDVEIVLVGPPLAPELDTLRRLANVRLLGARPYAAIPAYMQHADVGLLPLSDHPANAGRSPMKLYEYGAAGLPVLARHTEEISRRREPFVFTYHDAPEAVDLLGRLVTEGWPAATSAAAASAHSWEAIAQRLIEVAGMK